MSRIHFLSRSSSMLLLAATAACSADRTPLATAPQTDALTSVTPSAGGPAAPAVNGRIVFSARTEAGDRDIFSMNPDGTDRRRLTSGPADDWSPDVSPDGRKIAFTRRELGTPEQVYVMGADGSRIRKLTSFEPGTAREPAWSPDGKQIAFSGIPADTDYGEIFVMGATGRSVRRLTNHPDVPGVSVDQPAWSPDGARIAFTHRGTCSNVVAMNVDGSWVSFVTACETGGGQAPSWSPDGTRLAYERVTALESVLEVKPFGQPAQQIATNLRAGFGGPAWSPDGAKLVYPAIARVDGTLFATLATIGADGSGMLPLFPAGVAGMYPAWGMGR